MCFSGYRFYQGVKLIGGCSGDADYDGVAIPIGLGHYLLMVQVSHQKLFAAF